MQIYVNGKPEEVNPCSLNDYVNIKRLDSASLVIEYNKSIVKKGEWENIILKDGDTLEILGFVGGG